MKKSFSDKYGIALVIIVIGGWFIARQFGLSISLGKIILVLVGVAIVMYGVRMIRQNGNKNDEEQQWDHYNPNMAPPPPPPPGDEPFSSVNPGKSGVGANSTQSPLYGSSFPPGEETGPKSKQYDYNNYNYGKHSSSGGSIDRSVFIGDIHYGKQHWELKPMNLSAFIGDMKIDLSKAHIPYGETRIQISAFIGDVKVYIPNDVTLGVSIQMNAFIGDTKLIDQKESGLMGSYDLSTPNYHECDRKVLLQVSTFIGDVKVKRVG
ncbi:hypothetical protein J40TS1_12600 [Paenibacillus montaniterrae]|uniref:Cell wall-active antibiotics response LiaF-like C-terminal domain-containing protein n=1 Tax=Paenibacillus montaniterrae TaxID=429341 RepID=A0A919YRI3_9BACL|nr:cell wall-active antibiotics response protein LiaF [Paenibacillus montaniterrae]GIP15618.1 hypothetical protein J40TS1_12600 [Paenibacillus montaniterrae]